jgi:hypothetical protein
MTERKMTFMCFEWPGLPSVELRGPVDSTMPANYVWVDEEELWNSYATTTLTVYEETDRKSSTTPLSPWACFPPAAARAAAKPFHLLPNTRVVRPGTRQGRWRPWTGR